MLLSLCWTCTKHTLYAPAYWQQRRKENLKYNCYDDLLCPACSVLPDIYWDKFQYAEQSPLCSAKSCPCSLMHGSLPWKPEAVKEVLLWKTHSVVLRSHLLSYCRDGCTSMGAMQRWKQAAIAGDGWKILELPLTSLYHQAVIHLSYTGFAVGQSGIYWAPLTLLANLVQLYTMKSTWTANHSVSVCFQLMFPTFCLLLSSQRGMFI